ncbi:MAG: hypothetical protein ACRDAS_00560 [Cetobacterium sp.]
MIIEVFIYNIDDSLNVSYEVDTKKNLFRSIIFGKIKKKKKRGMHSVNKNRK